MRFERMASLTLATLLAGVAFYPNDLNAQSRSLADTSGPAELPPADFAGRQFVDSEGCVFMRTGRDGQTGWAPRVMTTDRSQVMCGFEPTFAAAPVEATEQPETTVAQASEPVPEITVTEPVEAQEEPVKVAAAEPAAPAPASASSPAASSKKTVMNRKGTASQAAAKANANKRSTVRKVPVASMKPQTVPQAPVAMPPVQAQNVYITSGSSQVGRTGCGASSLSARYLPGCGGLVTSDGVETSTRGKRLPSNTPLSPIHSRDGQQMDRSSAVETPSAAVDHRHAALTQTPSVSAQVAPPEGYRKIMTDGRHNPNRGIVLQRPAVWGTIPQVQTDANGQRYIRITR